MTTGVTPPPATVPAGAAGGAPPTPDAGTAPAVLLDGLTKRFAVRRRTAELLRRPFRRETLLALDDVSLRVAPGECVGLLGPNGAGKSTLFRVLLTLVLPDAGRAEIGGLDVVEDAEAVRHVVAGVSPDERSLYWRLSARENLRLYASLRGLAGEARERRVSEALAVVQLAEHGRQMVGRFSSGMRQRLLIARALLGRPSVLLLDEPTRSLDPVSAQSFRHFLREELVGRQGCAVLLATHTAEEAFDLCDRVVVLDRGRVVAQGPARQLAARHAPDRYELWLRGDEPAALAAVAGWSPARVLALGPADEAGWTRVRVQLDGGSDALAALVGGLVAAGVAVSRAEAVRPTLAELLAALTAAGRPPDAPREPEGGHA